MSEVVRECPLLKDTEVRVPGFLTIADYEVEMDKIASMAGSLISTVGGTDREELVFVVEMLYHLSASLREKFTLTDEEVERLISLGHKYDTILPKKIILPLGTYPDAGSCHIVRSEIRSAIVLLKKFEGKVDFDSRVFDILESLSNYFFGMAVYKNSIFTTEFKSRVY